MDEEIRELKDNIYSAFSNTASSIGYDEIHGRILAALMLNGGSLTLQELAEETGYSSSSISLSLDLLEVLEMIRKVKKEGDRKLYVEIEGSLLEGLKKAILIRIQKNITETLDSFDDYEERLEEMDSEKADKIIDNLERLKKNIENLEEYVENLAEVEIPEDKK
ncbi:MAG: MarR family transcriptional regulator [Candidatus Aenigmatarchaeota archaeon]